MGTRKEQNWFWSLKAEEFTWGEEKTVFWSLLPELPSCLVRQRPTVLKMGTRICFPSRMAQALFFFPLYHLKTWQLPYTTGTEQMLNPSRESQHRTPISSLLGMSSQQQGELLKASISTFSRYGFWWTWPQLLGFGLNSMLPTHARCFVKTLLSGDLRWV